MRGTLVVWYFVTDFVGGVVGGIGGKRLVCGYYCGYRAAAVIVYFGSQY